MNAIFRFLKNNYIKSISITLIFFSFCVDANPNFPKSRRITLRHIESGGVGYNTGYTTLEAFVSVDPTLWKATPFFDARGHLFDNGTWAANGGIGLRGQLGDRIYGINTYYDYRNTKHLHYNQASVGLETLGSLIDARINGYLPFGRKTSSPYDTRFGYFSDHYLFLSQKVEVAMKGIDAEVGFHLGDCKSWNFYTATGPYYFRGPKSPNAWGGKVRASIGYKDRIAFEVIESYDNVFHNNIQGQIALSFPLGRKTEELRTNSLYCRMVQPVGRSEIIVLNQKHRHSIAINPSTGSPYYFVFVNNMSSSNGTFESPYPSLALAQNNSLPHQIIYTFPGDGTTRNMDRGITLQASQKFWGSGIAHNLQTKQGLILVPQMSRTAPQITNTDLLGAGATLAANNEISGISFRETSGQAIFGTNPNTINLSSCSFISCGQGDLGIYPVALQTSAPLAATIENNQFLANQNAGVYIQLLPGSSSTQIAMNSNQAYNNTASSGGGAIMTLEAHGSVGSCELTMENNIFQNNGSCYSCNIKDLNTPHEGSYSSFRGNFSGNVFTQNKQGIAFGTNADVCTMSIQNNNLSNNTDGSISFLAGDGGTQLVSEATIIIDTNQINGGGAGGDAITISPAGDTISIRITNDSISNNIGTGFVSYFNQPGPDATLFIANNTIANNTNMNSNASGGISFDQFNSVNGTIQNNILSNNAGGNSIGINNGMMFFPSTSTITFTNNQLTEGDTFDFEFFGNSPATGCLTITGNTSTMSPTYTFQQQGSGSAFIVPCDFDVVNTGGFTTNAVPSTNCSGSSCP